MVPFRVVIKFDVIEYLWWATLLGQMTMEKTAVEHLVVLVHGTWARGVIPYFRKDNAPWCEDGSEVRESCKEVLGEDVVFHPFVWSGRNSPTARTSAAEQLLRTLQQLDKDFPAAKKFIVSHSHGGNIAMYAMRDCADILEIDGLACFSTPFLHVRPRNYRGNWFSVEWAGRFAAMILSMYMAVFTVVLATALYDIVTTRQFPESIQGWAMLLLWLLYYALLKNSAASMKTRADRFLDENELPNYLRFPVFLVRDTADEASNSLSASQFLSFITSKLYSLVVLILKPLRVYNLGTDTWQKLVYLNTPVIVLVFAIVTIKGIEESLSYWIVGISAAPLILYLSYFLLVLLCYVLIVTLHLLLSILMAPFGIRYSLLSVFIDISAEATPPGSWQVSQLGGAKHQFSQHATYENPAALEDFEKWLRDVIQE